MAGKLESFTMYELAFQLVAKQWEALPLFSGENKAVVDEWIRKARTVLTQIAVFKIGRQQLIGLVESKLVNAAYVWAKGLTEEELAKCEISLNIWSCCRHNLKTLPTRSVLKKSSSRCNKEINEY